MQSEAADADFCHSPGWGKDYPRIQLLTIAELLDGKKIDRPPHSVTFQAGPKGDGQEEGGIIVEMKRCGANKMMVVPVLRIVLDVAVVVVSLQASGADFLQIWPDARATALGGAMVGLADEANGVYWNPGGLGFQRGLSAAFTGANWLPGLNPGMFLADGDVNYGFASQSDRGVNVTAGLGWTHLGLGRFVWHTIEGDTTIRFSASDEAIRLHAGVAEEHVGVGLTLSYVLDNQAPWYIPFPIHVDPSGFIGNAIALDLGGIYKPVSGWSLGASVANMGTWTIYRDGSSARLPTTVRLGLAGRLLDAQTHSLLLLAAIEDDPYSYHYSVATSLGPEVVYRLNRAWKSLGCEGTLKRAFSRFSLTGRVGYFEDPSGGEAASSLWTQPGTHGTSALSSSSAKTIRASCNRSASAMASAWGYKDYIRLDVSDDHLIYDFPTRNLKFTLVTRDIIGLVRDLRGR